jgi:hypothetical protein
MNKNEDYSIIVPIGFKVDDIEDPYVLIHVLTGNRWFNPHTKQELLRKMQDPTEWEIEYGFTPCAPHEVYRDCVETDESVRGYTFQYNGALIMQVMLTSRIYGFLNVETAELLDVYERPRATAFEWRDYRMRVLS